MKGQGGKSLVKTVPSGEIKCMRGEMSRENGGLRGEIKGEKKVQIVLRETSKMCKGRKDYGEE